MAEGKKEKRIDVRSSSFKEIVNGEVVSKPDSKKPAGKPQAKPPAKTEAKKAEKPSPETREKEKKFVKRMIDETRTQAKAAEKAVTEVRGSAGFNIIENGDIIPPEAKGKSEEQIRALKEADQENVERNLKNSTLEGTFNSASGSIQSSFTTPLALALGASNAEIGILNSLQNLAGTVAHVPGAMLTKYFSRKSIWVMSQITSRIIIWIPILLLPLLTIENRVWILIVLILLSNFALMIRSPAWSSLMGDLVSTKIRGSYFGKRNMFVGVAGVLATLVAGFMLVYWGFPAIFALSMFFAAVSIFFFIRMREPAMSKIFHYSYTFKLEPKEWLKTLKINKEFTLFTVYLSCMNFAIDVAAPFYAVYMLKNLSIGYEWFAIAVVIGAMAKAFTNQYWGRLSDRFGDRKILIVSGFLGCFVPLGWMMVSNVWQVILVKIYDGIVFSGFELVIFNYLLDVTPAKERPKYIAAHNFFTGFGTVFGDLFGALLAQAFEGSAMFFFAGLQVVFLASFVLRLSCLSFLFVIKNIDVKQSGIVPVRYVFWQAVAVEPARGLKHALVFTFRYPSQFEKDMRESVKSFEYRLKMKMNK